MALSAAISDLTVEIVDFIAPVVTLNFRATVFGSGYVPANGSPERAAAYGLFLTLSHGMSASDIEDAMVQALLHHANVVEAANFTESLFKKNITVPLFRGSL